MARRWRPLQRLAHYGQFLAMLLLRSAVRLLPVDAGSDAMAAFARTVGPRLGWGWRVRANLRFVWPHLTEAEREGLVAEVCAMSARLGGDYCNLDRIAAEEGRRIEVVGGEHLDALRRGGRPAILFSAHMGNWVAILLAARRHGVGLSMVNRAANNPLAAGLVRRTHRATGADAIFLGREGARQLAERVAAGGHVLMLADVRLNSGVAVPFLGRVAMTPTSPARLALQHGGLLVPVRTERIGAARFRVTVEPPRAPDDTGDRAADIRTTMTWVNDRISAWITETPGQWFWFHLRWGKDPERDQERIRARL